jgi:hypothetical protein
VETEDVVHVLRHVHRAVRPGGSVLDVHPLGVDMAVLAGRRGLGFIDAAEFGLVIAAMDEGVAQVVREGLLEEQRVVVRQVVERFDDPKEALDHFAEWENLRAPPALRRSIRDAQERPIDCVDTVRYRLFARS